MRDFGTKAEETPWPPSPYTQALVGLSRITSVSLSICLGSHSLSGDTLVPLTEHPRVETRRRHPHTYIPHAHTHTPKRTHTHTHRSNSTHTHTHKHNHTHMHILASSQAQANNHNKAGGRNHSPFWTGWQLQLRKKREREDQHQTLEDLVTHVW